ncbi:MAG: hypothetical protein M3Z84_08705 [Actinomycetota bacterium]|nr:hypothetical protein [Actinomycetota bacterium]
MFHTESLQRVASYCDVSGGTSWFIYSASGVASGPYPGPFTEYGRVELSGIILSGGPGIIVHWDAVFTIDSPTAHVTGHKSLPSPALLGLCGDLGGPLNHAVTTLHYDAEIQPVAGEGGNYTDHGTAFSDVDAPFFEAGLAPPTLLYEVFTSDLTATLPLPGGGQSGGNGGNGGNGGGQH